MLARGWQEEVTERPLHGGSRPGRAPGAWRDRRPSRSLGTNRVRDTKLPVSLTSSKRGKASGVPPYRSKR